MDRSALERYTRRQDVEPEAGSLDLVEDAAEDLGCFGILRGMSARAIMLDLRKRDGNRMAISYAWIERIDFDPSIGITIIAGRNQIKVTGQGLDVEVRPGATLYEGLVRHRVGWIQAVEASVWIQADVAGPVVESISW